MLSGETRWGSLRRHLHLPHRVASRPLESARKPLRIAYLAELDQQSGDDDESSVKFWKFLSPCIVASRRCRPAFLSGLLLEVYEVPSGRHQLQLGGSRRPRR